VEDELSAYDELAAIDRSIRAGDTNLLEVLDFMRTMRLTHFSRDQIAAATAVNNVTPEPKPVVETPVIPIQARPDPIRNVRRS